MSAKRNADIAVLRVKVRDASTVRPGGIGNERKNEMTKEEFGKTVFVSVKNTWGKEIKSEITGERVSLADCAMGYGALHYSF